MDVLEADAGANPLSAMVLGLVEDPELRLFHADAATIKALSDQELAVGVMLTAPPGSDREQWIKERFGQEDEA